jgi:hypothetical protein
VPAATPPLNYPTQTEPDSTAMSARPPGDGRWEKMKAVTKDRPCPVCEGDHKCSVGDGGLILCGRRDGPVSGFRHLGASKGDP